MTKTNPYLAQDRPIVGDVYTSTEPMTLLTTLCDDFGSRFGGTEGAKLASDLLMEKFQAYGLHNVHKAAYDYDGWYRGEATLQVLSPVQRELTCISLPYCHAAEVEGNVVLVGEGLAKDFEKEKERLNGSIVLSQSGGIHRMEKYDRAILHDASGFIFQNHYPGYGEVTGTIGWNHEATIPGIGVSYETGEFLKRLHKQNGDVRVRIQTTDELRQTTAWNIVGELPGRVWPEEVIVVGCHYDGHDISQGANDPLSGMVVVTEMARVLSAYAADGLGRTVRFVAWSNEEVGLFGAYHDARQLSDAQAQVRFTWNLDSAGSPGGRKGIQLHRVPDFEPFIEHAAEEMALDIPIGQGISGYSDHFPYFLQGIPTGSIMTVGRPAGRGFGHTAFDTVDKTDAMAIREAAALGARIVLRMLSADSLPLQARSAEEVERMLKEDSGLEQHRLREAVYEKLGRENLRQYCDAVRT
ncbi:MAG: M28 family metallopeptidase [Candidatus Poribacteria bacterium]|nr:M28 family metallopeptidase [Candidatus Poribacteria bacterium]